MTRGRSIASLRDLRYLGEVVALVVVTWVLLGWYFDTAITQGDGTLFLVPYTQSQLAGGFDWTDHLYRFGVLGGSPMHDYAGTLPLVQLCNVLGVSATTAANLGTVFLQVCFGFFGLKSILALGTLWSQRPVLLSTTERLVSVLLCAFAPVLGWRLALGHESIVQGLLPIVTACALIWCARAKQLSAIALLFGWFAVWNAVSGFGAQMNLYGALFGAPIAVVVLFDGKWNRDVAAALAATFAGVLVALPRIVGVLAYATSGDAGRSVGGGSAIYELGTAQWSDWLTSIPWTPQLAGGALVHDVNYPLGPLAVIAILLWPTAAPRRLASGWLASVMLAVLFAAGMWPLSTLLPELLPPLSAFRIPARAILPALCFVPVLALASLWIAREAARDVEPDRSNARLLGWLGVVCAAGAIAMHGLVPASIREPLAWSACVGLAFVARWRPQQLQRHGLAAALALVGALGVLAFDERVPSHVPREPIEAGPRALRNAVLAQAPELAMPLNRVAIKDAPAPFQMGLAFAAGLSSLDGDFNPPRRFLQLLSALSGRELPRTAVVFELMPWRAFAILQRLYNIRYAITFERGTATLQPFPEPAGPAWFPREVVVADDAAAIAREMWKHPDKLSTIAWVLRGEASVAAVNPGASTCTGRVERVTTDELGQVATIDVDATTPCTLVVATNYVRTLRASLAPRPLSPSNPEGAANGASRDARPLPTFPIDIALVGIAVPAGKATVTLGPVPTLPWWARAGQLVGLVVLAAALARNLRRQPSE